MASAKIGRPTRGDAKKVVYYSNNDLMEIATNAKARGQDRQTATLELRKRGVEI